MQLNVDVCVCVFFFFKSLMLPEVHVQKYALTVDRLGSFFPVGLTPTLPE